MKAIVFKMYCFYDRQHCIFDNKFVTNPFSKAVYSIVLGKHQLLYPNMD